MTLLTIFDGPSTHTEEPAQPDLRIGELARVTGKTTRAIRLYEELGLLVPEDRSNGGFRLYNKASTERVRWISKLQDLGFTLQDIKVLVQTTGETPVPRQAMNHVKTIFQEKLSDVEDQMLRLTALKEELSSALQYLDGCKPCTADEDGASQCLQCDEQQTRQPPSLVHAVTKASSQLLHHMTPNQTAQRGTK